MTPPTGPTEPTATLRVVYSWSVANRPWTARCAHATSAVGRGATPPAALRDLLRRVFAPGTPRPDVVEEFELPADVLELQRRFERAATDVVSLESELTVALQRLRLPHSQIAARLQRSPQRLSRALRRRFVDRCP